MLARYYRKKGFVVASQDEATFGLIPNVIRGWARIGSRPIAPQNFQHVCSNIFGARTKRRFVFSFFTRKNQRNFVAFLKKLLMRWGRICLFTDNARWHRGTVVDEFLTHHQKTFKIIYFPKYCPELNPVEACWKPGRKAIGNRLIVSLDAMKYHLRNVFDNPFLMPKMFSYLSD